MEFNEDMPGYGAIVDDMSDIAGLKFHNETVKDISQLVLRR